METMEGKEQQRRLTEDGKKRKRPRDGGKGRKGQEGSQGGVKKHLDALSVGYFRRVSERLSEGFAEEEEKALFVVNVLSEVKGRATLVALDVTGSVTLQRLLPLATPTQIGELLAELGGATGADFRAVSCDRCGGHVMESALRQVPRWTEHSGSEGQETSDTKDDGDVEAGCSGILEAQVLSLCRSVTEEVTAFMRHTHGSHVARTLTHVLGGCLGPAHSDKRSGGKDQNVNTPLMDFEVPPSFAGALKRLSLALMENVNVCVSDAGASAMLQTMLTVCHRKRPKLCKSLLKGIVGYLTSLNSAPGLSPLLVFLKDQASSRLLETVLLLSHKAVLRSLYKDHLQGQLVNLALHPIANFPVQRLIATAASYKLFLKVFDELKEGLEAILAVGHMGVIVQLAESCAQREERQGEMMRCLLQGFHCAEPSSRQLTCLPLFLSLLTHDVYYCVQTAEGAADTQRPLSRICYHGSRLVQALLKFKDRSLLLNSLRALTPSDLVTLGTDQSGSHVLQAIMTSASDKGRGKILRRLEGEFVKLSCSRYGSRVLEAVWNSATVSQRQDIAKELGSSESLLRSDQFARHVWAKFALTHFVKRRAQWQEIQTDQMKKRKMFSDILQ
uniref:NOP9 nucleolar protein n=1 Tax=Paramormyrops kingsleyae TaxID=1676925 RepID=A0A3B3RG42_9TELE|nr:nucleolar protein 9 [Paramormyrops kingsleyae]XP_023660204.1 nucleolar protein 9 [Paramormyrops kingsleyae]XP_023660205.1 nucleolar protein 9 [Paramormyrops kingsleyae]XP_023660206.1 nucleolar protein 9 [Paramormyrops kingsleyae]